MRTDDLINALVEDRMPTGAKPGRALAFGVFGGALAAAAVFFATIGFRSDIGSALETVRFLFKFVVTLSLAATATGLVSRLARPGVTPGLFGWAMAATPVLLIMAVIAELVALPASLWGARLVGTHARLCLTLIPFLSIGPLAALILALRQGAPTRPGFAGAVAGLAASGIAATFYASNCTDDSPLFVATWYPLATVIVVFAGYIAGKRFLRW